MPSLRLAYNRWHRADPAVAGLPEELEKEGFTVEVTPYAGARLTYGIAVHVVESLEDHAIDALAALLVLKLRTWGRKLRSGASRSTARMARCFERSNSNRPEAGPPAADKQIRGGN